MTKRAEIVGKVFELLRDGCDLIKENDQCLNCPLHHICLDDHDYSVIDITDLISVGTWDEFIEYADHCVPSEELEELMRYAYEADKYRDGDF